MKKKQATALQLLVLYGLLIAAMLLLTIAGARCYAAVAERRSAHTQRRSAVSFLQTQAAACGGRGSVTLRDGPEGTAVCFREGGTDYETRVYLSGGALRTEFSRQDQPIEPANAEELCSADSFAAQWTHDALLEVTVDGRSAGVWCPGGGGNAE